MARRRAYRREVMGFSPEIGGASLWLEVLLFCKPRQDLEVVSFSEQQYSKKRC